MRLINAERISSRLMLATAPVVIEIGGIGGIDRVCAEIQ
jgi:hypothetical protein